MWESRVPPKALELEKECERLCEYVCSVPLFLVQSQRTGSLGVELLVLVDWTRRQRDLFVNLKPT
jgi:hypothetical protein